MCANFETIKTSSANWLKTNFGCDLPDSHWRDEAYPKYPGPFIYLKDGKPKCELAQFDLVPHGATDKKNSVCVHTMPDLSRFMASQVTEPLGVNSVLAWS